MEADPELVMLTIPCLQLLNQNQSSTAAWVQHVNGAAKLVRIRGPTRFTTEYEKNLLVASSGPIVRHPAYHESSQVLTEE